MGHGGDTSMNDAEVVLFIFVSFSKLDHDESQSSLFLFAQSGNTWQHNQTLTESSPRMTQGTSVQDHPEGHVLIYPLL